MKLVVQRVSNASVSVEGNEVSSIEKGLLILLGIAQEDTENDIKAKAEKIAKMRIMSDESDKMNLSVLEVKGSVLVVSQFTLLADTRKGNRPSFIKAAEPEKAKKLYELFVQQLKNLGVQDVQKGKFGEYMNVKLVNDGPVTIILEI